MPVATAVSLACYSNPGSNILSLITQTKLTNGDGTFIWTMIQIPSIPLTAFFTCFIVAYYLLFKPVVVLLFCISSCAGEILNGDT